MRSACKEYINTVNWINSAYKISHPTCAWTRMHVYFAHRSFQLLQ
jgi:hypothetical protein